MAHIMVSDDDASVLKLMAAVLTKAGHQVVTCASGQETLKKLGIRPLGIQRDDPALELPDLLILDIMMPESDGYTAATIIRHNPHTQGIPILVVSALRELSRLFTVTVQVDGFLTKPFAPENLLGKVANILEKRKAQDPGYGTGA